MNYKLPRIYHKLPTIFHKLSSHAGFRKYFFNTGWLFAEKVLRMAVGLFVGVWVARYLGPAQYGLLNYAGAFVGLFSVFATLGLDGIVVRELIKDESKKDVLLGTAFWLKIMGAIVMLIMIAIAVQFTSNDHYTNILVFIIAGSTIFQAFNVIDFYFQAKVLGKFIAMANSITLLLISIVKIALILYKAPLIAFVWASAFESLILALGYIYFYIKVSRHHNQQPTTIRHQLFHLTFNKKIAISLLKDSWPLILSGIAIMIYMRIDQVMLQEMIGSEAVGQYSAAVRISEAWYFIPMVISSSLFPAIVNAKKQSEELYYARLQRLYDLMVWISLAIALPMTFLSDWVVNLLYGSAYSQAGSVLMIHIWAGVFVSLGVASGRWFITENLQSLSFLRSFYGMVINLILNFILIPKFGVQGAAVATLISQVIAAYIFDFFNYKTRVMFFMKTKSFFFVHFVHLIRSK